MGRGLLRLRRAAARLGVPIGSLQGARREHTLLRVTTSAPATARPHDFPGHEVVITLTPSRRRRSGCGCAADGKDPPTPASCVSCATCSNPVPAACASTHPHRLPTAHHPRHRGLTERGRACRSTPAEHSACCGCTTSGTAYGPPSDQIDVEVWCSSRAGRPTRSGFQLRDDGNQVARRGMLDLLRDGFNQGATRSTSTSTRHRARAQRA